MSNCQHFTFYEFFAGGGMARAGLGKRWKCLFANDNDPKKAKSYRTNWGENEMFLKDVADVTTEDLEGNADLAWASFPCQDLSLAGANAGLGHALSKNKTRSGTFWMFWRLMKELNVNSRAPKIIVLENVSGILKSNNGADFRNLASALSGADYNFGALLIDAKKFVPQSRPRVFIVAVKRDIDLPSELTTDSQPEKWSSNGILYAHSKLTVEARKKWIWWKLPNALGPVSNLSDIVVDDPIGVDWNSEAKTQSLINLMSAKNLEKLEVAKSSGSRVVGGLYRRTRIENQKRVQRAEIRFDGISGCLRTPSGGSSRQTVVVVNGNKVRSRLLSTREAANLMGLKKDYILPERYNDAYHLLGDGLVVPAVAFLSKNILEPVLNDLYSQMIAAE